MSLLHHKRMQGTLIYLCGSTNVGEKHLELGSQSHLLVESEGMSSRRLDFGVTAVTQDDSQISSSESSTKS